MGTRRTFPREAKVEAVKLVTGRGLSFTQAARNPGITDGRPWKWRQTPEADAEPASPGHGHRTPAEEGLHRLRAEEGLHRLRAENRRHRAERDVLKNDGLRRARPPGARRGTGSRAA
jgi:transposase-like protein